MSKVAVRPLSDACSSDGASLAGVAPKLLSLSVKAMTDMLQGMAGLLGPVLSASSCPPAFPARSRTDCCEIPEVDCPPRCVCEISWEAPRGETLRCAIRLVNTSLATRTFTAEGTSFTGDQSGEIQVSPAAQQVGGGMSGGLEARFEVPKDMAPGEYEAEIVVRGAYEQCIRVLLRVTEKDCGPDMPACRCTISQGDPPVRVRAHHWYHHFQCSEPCARPSRRVDNRDPDHR